MTTKHTILWHYKTEDKQNALDRVFQVKTKSICCRRTSTDLKFFGVVFYHVAMQHAPFWIKLAEKKGRLLY